MLRRLLIANRGEIACRIMRTARRLGITSIAVFSDADRRARHVREADEAYLLGEAPASQSYLNIPKIVALAGRVGADAIHPGYGFLSENAEFAQAVQDAGLIFVGPPASAIRAMGSKSASKAAMAAIGVPVAPGYHGEEQSGQRLASEASRIGFPLIIKASAGGGGKGMQVVHSPAQVPAAVESAQRLARTAFGDARLLLERYFPNARHVEVQIFADSAGRIVSLFDRDCSVQRRHQKIIEEAPAPGLRAAVRTAMAQAAIQAAGAVNYVGAGTVEFLLDEEQKFYFMEMNTRLQVEHPVTENITGLDLVEWQLRVARGEPLPLSQADIAGHGVAIEARLYAEDPRRGYLPSVGRISHLRWPEAAPQLRLEVGVGAGDEISPFYDPLLGKVIAWGDSRGAAIERLRRGLAGIEIAGVTTNRALLLSILGDEVFGREAVATNFLELREHQLLFGEPAAATLDFALAALWCATGRIEPDALWEDTRGWRLSRPPSSMWRFTDTNAGLEGGFAPGTASGRSIVLEAEGAGAYCARIDATVLRLQLLLREAHGLAVEISGQALRVRVVEVGAALHLYRDERQATLLRCSTEDALQVTADADHGSLLTPLPGTIVAVHVERGEHVSRGAALVTVEAMKMEHTLTAPHAGIVSRVTHALADRVAAGAVLVELQPLDASGGGDAEP
jgi:3-methylcrotonyl-CoA carboxylase alpha subunit